MTDDLQIGVIGSGGRGGLARHAHWPSDGSRVVACCDIEAEVFDSCRDWYGSDIFTTSELGELLERDLDAVFITTPDFLHERHAVAATAVKVMQNMTSRCRKVGTAVPMLRSLRNFCVS